MNRRAFLVSSFILGLMRATGIRPVKPGLPQGGRTVYYEGPDVVWRAEIVYDRPLTDEEHHRVLAYIGKKHGIPA